MKICLLILVVLVGTLPAKEQTAYAVWSGKNCVVLSENVRAFAPLKDGLPDYQHVRVTGVQLDPKCMVYEVR